MNPPVRSAFSGHTHNSWPSMIVGDLHFESVAAPPHETDPVLIVDPNAVLPLPVAMQFLQPISGGNLQIIESGCAVEHAQFSPGHARGRCAPCLTRPPDFHRLPVGETPDHCPTIT